MTLLAPEELLLVGRISSAFGVRGQLKMRAITDRPEHLSRYIRTVYVGDPPNAYSLKRLFMHKPGLWIVSLGGVDTRESAESLRGAEVFIRQDEAAPLEQDEYYLHQLYDLQVVTEDGALLGQVREVLETGANEVLVVSRRGQSDALIPMIRDVVQQIDIDGGRIVIRLIEGLL